MITKHCGVPRVAAADGHRKNAPALFVSGAAVGRAGQGHWCGVVWSRSQVPVRGLKGGGATMCDMTNWSSAAAVSAGHGRLIGEPIR